MTSSILLHHFAFLRASLQTPYLLDLDVIIAFVSLTIYQMIIEYYTVHRATIGILISLLYIQGSSPALGKKIFFKALGLELVQDIQFIWSDQLPNAFCKLQHFIWPDLFWPCWPNTKCHLFWFDTKCPYLIWPVWFGLAYQIPFVLVWYQVR